jgi:hypothetical protein
VSDQDKATTDKQRETCFLLACLKNGNSNRPTSRNSPDDLDWNYVFHLAEAHGLIPLLYLKLKDDDMAGMPPAFIETAGDHFQANELRNRMLREELLRLLENFAEAGIRGIPLKGVVYAHTLYEHPAARQFGDIDFLVGAEDIDRAKNLLEQQHYRTVYEPLVLSEGNTDLSPAQQSVYRHVYHEYELRSSDGLVHVDLHWRLLPRTYPTELPIDLIWQNLTTASINGVPVAVVCPELDLLYLCIHGAKDGWSELKWATDISSLIGTADRLDWNRVQELSRGLRCRKMLWAGLQLANWVTGVPVPEHLDPHISSDPQLKKVISKLQRRLLSQPERKFRRVPCLGINKTYLQLCDSWIDQLRYTFRMLTYTQVRDWNLFGFDDKPPRLWPYIRPFRILARCVGKAIHKTIRP